MAKKRSKNKSSANGCGKTAAITKKQYAKQYALYETSVGCICISYNSRAITGISLCPENNPGRAESRRTQLTDTAYNQLSEYLDGMRKTFDFMTEPDGTPFQKSVWDALCRIPYGELRSYKEIAEEIGRPKAARAVGGACHNNPLLIAVPCHRVIGTNGRLTGYAYGEQMKQKLIGLERNNL